MVALPEHVTVSMSDLLALSSRINRVAEGVDNAEAAVQKALTTALADLAAIRRNVADAREVYTAWGVKVHTTQLPPAGSGEAVGARVPTTPPSGLHDARATGATATAAMRDAAADGAYTPYADSAAVAAIIGEGCTEAFVLAHSAARGQHGKNRPCPCIARGAVCQCSNAVRTQWRAARTTQQAQDRVDATVNGATTTAATPTTPPVTAAPDPMNPLANAAGRATWAGYVKAYVARGMSHDDAMMAADATMSEATVATTTAPAAAPVAPVQEAPSTDAPPATDALPCPTEAAFAVIRAAFFAAPKLAYIDALYHARANGAPDPDGAAYGVDAKVVRNVNHRFAGAVK